MKLREISAAAIALMSGLLLSNSHVGRVHADEKVCSTKTLNGSYGFYRSGTTSTGPLTAVGFVFYDGNGNNTATQTISRNGVFTLDQTTVGQYEDEFVVSKSCPWFIQVVISLSLLVTSAGGICDAAFTTTRNANVIREGLSR